MSIATINSSSAMNHVVCGALPPATERIRVRLGFRFGFRHEARRVGGAAAQYRWAMGTVRCGVGGAAWQGTHSCGSAMVTPISKTVTPIMKP
jgi:hypothetical protein